MNDARYPSPQAAPDREWVADAVRWLEGETPGSAADVRASLAARIPEYQPAGPWPAVPISTSSAAAATTRFDRADASGG